MEAVCRLCARESNILESVFTFQNDRILADLISIICPIKIDINENFPKKICEECLEIILSASKLRETSLKNDVLFRSGKFVLSLNVQIKQEKPYEDDPLHEIYEQSNSDGEDWLMEEQPEEKSKGSNKKQETKDQATKVQLNSNNRYECPSNCGHSFAFQTNVWRHIRRFHDPDLLPFACDLCTLRFKERSKLNSHVTRVHEDNIRAVGSSRKPVKTEKIKVKQEINDDDDSSIECDLCGTTYQGKANMANHMKLCHNRTIDNMNSSKSPYAGAYECNLCYKTFATIGIMVRHKSRFHSEDNPFPCALCADRFTTVRRLELHHQKNHKGQDFSKTQRSSLEEKKIKPEICQYCGDDFTGLKKKLEFHLLQEHSDQFTPLRCTICTKIFVFPESLKIHTETHKQIYMQTHQIKLDLPPCYICGKTMSSNQALNRHIRHHEKKKEEKFV